MHQPWKHPLPRLLCEIINVTSVLPLEFSVTCNQKLPINAPPKCPARFTPPICKTGRRHFLYYCQTSSLQRGAIYYSSSENYSLFGRNYLVSPLFEMSALPINLTYLCNRGRSREEIFDYCNLTDLQLGTT